MFAPKKQVKEPAKQDKLIRVASRREAYIPTGGYCSGSSFATSPASYFMEKPPTNPKIYVVGHICLVAVYPIGLSGCSGHQSSTFFAARCPAERPSEGSPCSRNRLPFASAAVVELCVLSVCSSFCRLACLAFWFALIPCLLWLLGLGCRLLGALAKRMGSCVRGGIILLKLLNA